MSDRPPARLALILLLFAAPLCVAQQPAAREEQETVKVYTEEVRLPVVAYNDRERFDPTLAADDVLMLEDGVPQHVRSVRRVPATYKPLRPFAEGGAGERRRAKVSARRMGLQLFTLRSVVTAPQRTTQDEK